MWSLELRAWIASALSSPPLSAATNLSPDDDLLWYLSSIPSTTDVVDYLRDLLGHGDAVDAFLKELRQRIRNDSKIGQEQSEASQKCLDALGLNSDETPYMKPSADSLVYVPGKHKHRTDSSTRKKPPQPPPQQQQPENPHPKSAAAAKPAKGAPVNLSDFRANGMVPGQHPCTCLGQRHRVLVNCLNCGRIICEQEGPGACLTCGFEIFSEKPRQKILRQIRKGKEMLISAEEMTEALRQAEAQKAKLLEYDRDSVRRTQVIDDEMDYFQSQSNEWLTDEERARLRAREEEIKNAQESSAKSRQITLDIAGRRVVSEPDTTVEELKKLYREEIESSRESKSGKKKSLGTGYYLNSSIDVAPVYLPTGKEKAAPKPSHPRKVQGMKTASHIQHSLDGGDVLDESDAGVALSMWQPWASLLVHGVKLVEGRSWPISHRGRLWIAAASKKVPETEMQQVIEDHCRHLSDEQRQQLLPKYYPTSCIVGCVDVVDCLSQEEYAATVPPDQRQSDSAFVYLCENPCRLVAPVPVSGQHKLWSLKYADHALACSRIVPSLGAIGVVKS